MSSNKDNRYLPGKIIGGRYTLVNQIARGGMGEVWRARDKESGTLVAAKVLRPEFFGEETSLSRLRIEARNAMRVEHPNVAQVLDSGQDGGRGWIVMELVEGHPFNDYLRGGKKIPLSTLIPILVQVAMALHSAARVGVVHRDIKPANILITNDGTVKLTDFGISHSTGQATLTAAGMVMGTAQYLAPEQALGKRASSLGDLYALGVVAYEAVSGRLPFSGKTQVDIAFAHVNHAVPSLPSDVPDAFAKLVLCLLSKEPEKRMQSGLAVARKLSEIANSLNISIAPKPLPLPDTAKASSHFHPATSHVIKSSSSKVSSPIAGHVTYKSSLSQQVFSHRPEETASANGSESYAHPLRTTSSKHVSAGTTGMSPLRKKRNSASQTPRSKRSLTTAGTTQNTERLSTRHRTRSTASTIKHDMPPRRKKHTPTSSHWRPVNRASVSSIPSPNVTVKNAYSRSVVSPPRTRAEQLGRALITILIILTLVLIVVATIHNRFGSLSPFVDATSSHIFQEASHG